MRFTLSNFTDSDDRSCEVCELYGSTVLEIPDIIVAKARLIIQRAVTAQLNGATADTLTRIVSEFRAYPIRRPTSFELDYDDSDYDCICSSANLYTDIDYDGSPRLAVDFEVEYCDLCYDDDGDVTNYGEYDETDYITIDLTREILCNTLLAGEDLRNSAAMVFTFNVPVKKDAVNDSEATLA